MVKYERKWLVAFGCRPFFVIRELNENIVRFPLVINIKI